MPLEQRIKLKVQFSDSELFVDLNAPFLPNLQPSCPAGPTDKLWEYDVVEIFFLGENERYLEVEMGPFGHYLVLMLEGRRCVQKSHMPLLFTADICRDRWRGHVAIPTAYLPKGLSRWNAYAIYSAKGRREHFALYALGGDAPDFHRLEDFGVFPFSR